MKKLAIIGSGDLGKLIAHHAQATELYTIAGFFDDFKTTGDKAHSHPILGGKDNIQPLFEQGEFDELMVGIGYKYFDFRKAIFEQFKGTIPFARVIHPSAYIDPSATIGEGVLIHPNCTLDMNVIVGDNVLLNTAVSIAHDSDVGNHSFLSPNVSVAGFVKIGKCCNIGINTTIIDNITIVDQTQTGGGTVVVKDIEKSGLYVGNPARFIR